MIRNHKDRMTLIEIAVICVIIFVLGTLVSEAYIQYNTPLTCLTISEKYVITNPKSFSKYKIISYEGKYCYITEEQFNNCKIGNQFKGKWR